MQQAFLSPIPNDWERHFERAALTKGREIQRQGKVLRCQPVEDCPGIVAQVQGSFVQPYEVDIVWNGENDAESFVEGECSCPMEFNCKHVAAAIVEALGNPGSANSAKIARPAPKLSQQARNWLEELHQAAAPPPSEAIIEPGTEQQRLAYVLKFETATHGISKPARPQLGVHLYIVRKLLNGNYGQGSNCTPEQIIDSRPRPSYARASDVALVRRLKLVQPQGFYY